MKTLSLVGNCQLQQVGYYLSQIASPMIKVNWYLPPFLMKEGAALINFYKALEGSDGIYVQYHDDKWEELASQRLGKYFELRVVPTLESPCSCPQIGYLGFDNKFNVWDIDFRFLDLYLKGVSHMEAAEKYHDCSINSELLLFQTERVIKKYKDYYEGAKVIADYSLFYRNSLLQFGASTFFTHNHPRNVHLQWLADVITYDLVKEYFPIFSSIPEVLVDTIAPAIGSNSSHYTLKSVDLGLQAAAKVFFTVFDSLNLNSLKKEFEGSVYFHLRA